MNLLILSGASFDSIVYLDAFPKPEPRTIHQCRFSENVGSTGVGKAANLCRLGFKTTLHAMIGDDFYGEKIKSFFSDKPVRFLYFILPSGTERHVNIMNKDGQRISVFVNPTPDAPDFDYRSLDSAIRDSEKVVLNIVNYARNFIPALQKHKKEIWTDLHDYDGVSTYHQDFIDAAHYVFLSSDNLVDYRKTMGEIMQTGKKLVVCTHGKKGATALQADGKWLETPVIKDFTLVDSNGAGDAFFSGFFYGHYRQYELEKCMLLGHILGGLCISSPLISPENLEIELVEAYLRKYSG